MTKHISVDNVLTEPNYLLTVDDLPLTSRMRKTLNGLHDFIAPIPSFMTLAQHLDDQKKYKPLFLAEIVQLKTFGTAKNIYLEVGGKPQKINKFGAQAIQITRTALQALGLDFDTVIKDRPVLNEDFHLALKAITLGRKPLAPARQRKVASEEGVAPPQALLQVFPQPLLPGVAAKTPDVPLSDLDKKVEREIKYLYAAAGLEMTKAPMPDAVKKKLAARLAFMRKMIAQQGAKPS